MTVVSTFDVTGWDATPTDTPEAGPDLSRVALTKTFAGDFEGTSSGEGLFCGMGAPEAGAGYLVSERLAGRIGEREGTFVIQHGGLMGPEVAPHTFGNIVPGSGTGALAGIAGTVQIAQADGTHTMTLEVTLPPEA
ncbi:DUF3224 domain-containing protein [Rubricoccus marinus]|uniref:DUF3224 domain-containing protein n=1 Tax=Rubricoccus marinus TaxID=716817 RepID=A0A259U3P5_9BACT|nr:DUF3224 domain-containing protein [Rubricoccus marinus]OZC04448.1 hypothetical protein BSZ36_16545 [Rubricoccus marinus]